MENGQVFINGGGIAAVAIALLVVLLCLGAAPSADAAEEMPLLWRSPEDGQSGEAAGLLRNPEAVAVNTVSGHLYVIENDNARVSEFDAWGQFVRAWGWGVRDGSLEFQICSPATSCQTGIEGSGQGQFNRKLGGGGIAVAPDGSVYVGDPDNFRIEKFDSAGKFLLEFGEQGVGPGQLQPGTYLNNIAIGPDGTIYIGEKNRVQSFEPSGNFKEEIPFVGEMEALKDKDFRDLVADESGNLYAAVVGLEEVVKFDPTGKLVSPQSFPLVKPRDLAVDQSGNLFTTEAFQEVVKFDKDANLLIPPDSGFGRVNLTLTGLGVSSACGIDGNDLYAVASSGTTKGFVTAYGPPPDPDLCPPPLKPPTIVRQFASSVSTDSAVVKAGINPHFWPDTTFYVEYGTAKCSDGGCTSRQPVTDRLLGDLVIDKAVITDGVWLSGLKPGTEYHFRFAAESSGGGPTVGGEKTFTTSEDDLTSKPCPNDAFRRGPGKLLPDCRAYEMVSPADKGGGEVFTLFNSLNERASLNQSSLTGDRITYSSYRAFADPQSAPATLQYLASRSGSGWVTKAISPPRGTPSQGPGQTVETQFRAFGDNLCDAWLVHDTDPPLAPEAVEGFPNLYKTNLCDEEDAYEALTMTAPGAGQIPKAYRVNVQGFSADGTHTVFRAFGKLTSSAAENTNYQCYEHFDGKLRLVSVLPSGQPSPGQCSIGTAYSVESPHAAQVHNAVSEDGSRIYWTAGDALKPAVEQGRIYLRVNGKNPTLAVSQAGEAQSGTTAASNYWTASPDGSVAIFSTGSMRAAKAGAYEFRLADKSTHLIAHEVRGYLGASENASVIYLASEEVLSGANGEGNSPVAGEPNLYRYDAGDESFHFIQVLSGFDAKSEEFLGVSPLAGALSQHTARVSEDGRVAVFMSTAPLTGFDNTDAVSGEPDAEVFRYDAAANGGQGALTCVSCNPTGAAPSGREPKWGELSLNIWVAAQIPPWESPFNAPRVLPEDGERVLFESYEPLVARDTNGKQDVYQWSAVGAANCEEDSPDYSAPNDGCVSLISSGQSTRDSEFVDASESGKDIFFATASSLVAQDPGLIDLYDARELGGFPPPPPPATPCLNEGCQNPGAAPDEHSPGSQQPGPGNPTFKPEKPKCPKGKVRKQVKGKSRCINKHHKHKKHKAKKTRRVSVT